MGLVMVTLSETRLELCAVCWYRSHNQRQGSTNARKDGARTYLRERFLELFQWF